MLDANFIEVKDQFGVRDVEYLASAIWPECYESIVGRAQVDYMLKHFQTAEAVTAQIKEGYRYFLIFADKEFVGYFAIIPYEKKGELFLSKIYIRADQRGKGVGQQVLGFVEAVARSQELPRIVLTVNKNNVSAQQFYERNGFVNVDSVAKDIGGGFVMDDYIYAKETIDPWAKALRERKDMSRFLVDDPAKVYYLVASVIAVVLLFVIFFPKPHPSAGESDRINIAGGPAQGGALSLPAIEMKPLGGNFVLNPVAEYKIAGRVISKYYYWPYEVWDRLSPFDVMIAWGDLALPENIKYVSVRHDMRTHSFGLKPGAPFDQTFLDRHASNNHIISADMNIQDAITSVRAGQKIMLEGMLVNAVNLNIQGYQEWKSSLRRDDIGVGSCEVLYVTRVTVDGKVYE